MELQAEQRDAKCSAYEGGKNGLGESFDNGE